MRGFKAQCDASQMHNIPMGEPRPFWRERGAVEPGAGDGTGIGQLVTLRTVGEMGMNTFHTGVRNPYGRALAVAAQSDVGLGQGIEALFRGRHGCLITGEEERHLI